MSKQFPAKPVLMVLMEFANGVEPDQIALD